MTIHPVTLGLFAILTGLSLLAACGIPRMERETRRAGRVSRGIAGRGRDRVPMMEHAALALILLAVVALPAYRLWQSRRRAGEWARHRAALQARQEDVRAAVDEATRGLGDLAKRIGRP